MGRARSFFAYRRLPRPKPQHDIAVLMKYPKRGNDGKLHGAFETIADSRGEDKTRIELLTKSSHPKARKLARRLKKGLPRGKFAATYASSTYARAFRRRLIGMVLKDIEPLQDVFHTTLINTHWNKKKKTKSRPAQP